MGCFDYTCAISGLPIRAGDDVRWLILTENPYEDSGRVSIHDFAYPRIWPVRAKYNDYGSIEAYDRNSPAVIGVVEGFKEDLIEVGWGDNTCHDVPTAKGMDFEKILTAIIEERMLVKRETWKREAESEPPAELPTLQRVWDILTSNGEVVNNMEGAFLVDQIAHGWVRVRPGGYANRTDRLKTILPLFQKSYAAMITASSGSSFSPEIQVMPLPNDKHVRIDRDPDKEEKPLGNFQAFIHGRVWDAILTSSKFGKIRAKVQEEWDSISAAAINGEELERLSKLNPELADMLSRKSLRRNLGRSGYLGFSSIPFSMGPGEHTYLIADYHAKKPFTEQQIKDFLDDVAGFACINEYLMRLNYWWRPSWYAGQGNTYREHLDWHTKLTAICQEIRTENAEYCEMIDEMESKARARDEADEDQI